MTSGLRPVGHAVALIKWAGGRECECPLRVNRESAYAGSNYQAIYWASVRNKKDGPIRPNQLPPEQFQPEYDLLPPRLSRHSDTGQAISLRF